MVNNKRMFIKSFKKCDYGKISPVFYCNNVAIIGGRVVDNREQVINRGHKQQTEIKFNSKRSKQHFWPQARRPDRRISALDTMSAMQYGIKFRSDIKIGKRWETRLVYIWHDLVVVTLFDPKHLITAYRIDPLNCTFIKD